MLDPHEAFRSCGVVRPFIYEWKGENSTSVKFETSISIPPLISVDDHLATLCSTYSVPVYFRDDLRNALSAFLQNETDNFYDTEADTDLQNFDEHDGKEVDETGTIWVEEWESKHKTFAPCQIMRNDDVFREAYQSLLKADYVYVQRLLKTETEFAGEMQNLIKERDWEVERLKKEHCVMIEKVVSEMGSVYSEQEVNRMAGEHFERLHLVESNYASQISSLATEQRRAYQELVLRLNEDSVVGNCSENAKTRREDEWKDKETNRGRGMTGERDHAETAKLEESFTIHLGAQQKTMHNLRLISMNPSELCNHKSKGLEESRRLQMALSLYSGQLHGMVCLVDSRPNYHITFRTDFARSCEQATELHFADLETQLADISSHVTRANECRHSRAIAQSEMSNRNGENAVNVAGEKPSGLKTGDVYLTRHSNLSHIHVAFHLVADDALQTQEISSRHPCINGLRNIIRLCYKFDITTISLPLLLVKNMTEELTVSWCAKRAELVFKCVKGFMMECATLSGSSEQYTVQFLVPPDVSIDVFHQLSDILMSIFHVAQPVVVQSTG